MTGAETGPLHSDLTLSTSCNNERKRPHCPYRQQMKLVVAMTTERNCPVFSYDLETFALGML